MDSIFTHIYYNIKKWRIAFFILILAFLSACFYFISNISFDEDITNILPKENKNEDLGKVFQQLDFSDKITVMISAETDSAKLNLAHVAQTFLDSLAKDSLYYTDIQGKVGTTQIDETFSFVYDNLPLFLDDNDYQNIKNRIGKDSINKRIEDNYKTLISPTGLVARDFILRDPLGFSFIGLKKLRSLGVSKEFIINNGYVSTADSSTILLFITPTFKGTDTKKNEGFVHQLYSIQDTINAHFKDQANISYFGSPFIALANANQIKSDIKTTVVLALAILMLILILFYKRLYIPIILFIPAVCGAALSLTILYFLNHSISAISISIGAILLGVTLDYSLHIITHYREHSDIKTLYKNVTKPLLGCSLTTAAAFSCLLLVKSKVLQELGIFAAISIMASALFALILIPHLYVPKEKDKVKARTSIIDRLGAYSFEKNKFLIGIILLAIVLGVFSFSKVRFNNDISALNFIPENMKASEKKLEQIGSMGGKSIYLSVYGDSLDPLLSKNTTIEKQLIQLKSKGLIKDYTSVGGFVFSKEDQLKKINQWNEFWGTATKDSTLLRVNTAAGQLGFNADAFQGLDHLLNKEYQPISIEEYQNLDLPLLKESLINKSGFITLSSIIQTDSIHRLEVIHSLEQENVITIDRKHISEQFLGQIRDDFKNLMNYALIVVFLIFLFFFKRIELALLGLIPIVLTGIVTMGFIYLFNLELNIFSLIVTTLIIGVGVDFSIFMTSGLQKRYTTGVDELKTYRISIILAVLTTVLSIGVLIFAKHPALKSISWIALIGILSAMLITFSFYPLLFKKFVESRPKKGKAPISLRLFISALISFGYFGAGSLIISFIGLILGALPINKKKKQIWFRRVIAKFTKSVMYTNYGSKNVFNNPSNEQFKKPAIVIANHSSFLDTLSIGFLPTRFVFLVNKWVYNSPVFGKAIQSAGYFPVEKGIEDGEDEILEMIKNGVSVVVFPEGTRSFTGSIARFHKGAFLLAQKHNIDIVPLYIHGNFNLLPKGDFVIFDGIHTLELGERIEFNEEDEKKSIRDLTRSISQKFKDRFREIRVQLEDENYFKQKIKLNFLYKTQDIVQQSHQEFTNNKTLYHQINPYIDNKANILRIGNDLGIWDMMLVLQQGLRKVYSYIEDKELREVAVQSYLTNHRALYYLDSPQSTKTNVLLITTPLETNILSKIIEEGDFKQIIVVSNSIDDKLITKFGYEIQQKDTEYYILNQV